MCAGLHQVAGVRAYLSMLSYDGKQSVPVCHSTEASNVLESNSGTSSIKQLPLHCSLKCFAGPFPDAGAVAAAVVDALTSECYMAFW